MSGWSLSSQTAPSFHGLARQRSTNATFTREGAPSLTAHCATINPLHVAAAAAVPTDLPAVTTISTFRPSALARSAAAPKLRRSPV